MASRKSLSSAPSASRADTAARFRAALDAVLAGEGGSLQHALEQSLQSPELQRCTTALSHAAAAAAATQSDSHPRPRRIPFPAGSLPPLP